MTEPAPATEAPLRVLVVDSDDQIRESLTRLLRIGGRCLVVGSAGHPDAALALAQAMSPDVAVIDSRVSGVSASGAFLDCLRAVVPGVRVVALSWSDASDQGTGILGADAYIRKTFRSHELIDAVVAAARPTVD
jgi:DNA-binding NarL/FixJ family response regulator